MSGTRLFAEQAAVLEGRGVDLFMVETFYDLEELEHAIEAVRSVSSLPIVALLTFDEDAETLAGVAARTAAERLRELGVAAIGANHGAGLQAALDGARADGRRRPAARGAAEHRSRQPRRRQGDLPARHAGVLRRVRRPAREASAPASSAAVAARRRRRSPPFAARSTKNAVPSAPLEVVERDAGRRFARRRSERETRLAARLPRGSVRRLGADRPAAGGRLLGAARDRRGDPGVGRSRLRRRQRQRDGQREAERDDHGLRAIERRLGVETIPHLTSRDYSIMGLEALLLGAHAEGVRNILAVTGDPPEVGDYPG